MIIRKSDRGKKEDKIIVSKNLKIRKHIKQSFLKKRQRSEDSDFTAKEANKNSYTAS